MNMHTVYTSSPAVFGFFDHTLLERSYNKISAESTGKTKIATIQLNRYVGYKRLGDVTPSVNTGLRSLLLTGRMLGQLASLALAC